MNRIIWSWEGAAVLLIAVTAIVPAEATVDHTYVSGKGTDTGGASHLLSAARPSPMRLRRPPPPAR
jgi:hypothetical protein